MRFFIGCLSGPRFYEVGTVIRLLHRTDERKNSPDQLFQSMSALEERASDHSSKFRKVLMSISVFEVVFREIIAALFKFTSAFKHSISQ